ncbi:GGDEF domain-containing protein [Bacillus sp. Marseille-P3661]|uniref:GGDEF domain-containing protein n=1 Tax=Bacillus sp. Marseille-P3661 TaxID=1936234 RepID=UPI000C840972|nr:GGDEF domain-containing protein [Bacillus sp. Marseille-P3661]
MTTHVGEIVDSVPCIPQYVVNKVVNKVFSENTKLQGIVVVNNNIPISLITRSHFYQKIGTQYGYNLYMGRTIDLTAKKNPLIVDYFQPITEVSKLAMERKEEDLYDYVIVTKEGSFAGIVSIQKLLMKLVEIQVEVASFLNPLTGLPGNQIIDRKLTEVIQQEKFTIIYFDLDKFKEYNDTYGFKKGDELLLGTSSLLEQAFDSTGAFLGHIGGDDFIAILNSYDFNAICEGIISDFDMFVKRFYKSKHLLQQFVETENRLGIKEKISLVSLSIAIVTNQHTQFKSVEELAEYAAVVKKMCKKVKGSCCLINP